MVRGGRVYGRGSGGGRGSYRGSSSNYRSSSGRNNSSGGGGGSSYSSSRNYSSSSSRYPYDNSRSSDRFSSSRHSDRHDDHKRSYRTSSRDRSPDRKRSRHEDSRLSSSYSSSSYRGGGESSSRSSRRTPPPPSSSSSSNRGSSSYRRDREGSSSHRHHSSMNDSSSMGPPKHVPPRSNTHHRLTNNTRSSRGGNLNRLRGSNSRGVRIIRSRHESTDMRIMRRKLLLARQKDRIRRIKIAKLTSSLRRRRDTGGIRSSRPVRKSSRSDKKDDTKKIDDKDKKKTSSSTSSSPSSKNDADDKDKDGSGDEKGEESDHETTGEGGGGGTGENNSTKKKESSINKRSDNHRTDDEDDKNEKDDNIKEKDKDGSKSPKPRSDRPFIKLNCCHCRAKYKTFKEYIYHLRSRSHKISMRRLSLRQKSKLSQMRAVQRKAQRELEETSKDEIDEGQSEFCLLCRLNYRTPKAKHQLSEAHRNMKKFLMPYCNTCRIAFKSPMVYESHRCSLDHLKRKAIKNNDSHSDASGDEKEVDLNNFLTVDSVGEIDGNIDIDEKNDDGKEKVNVGSEHVKKTEALYCDLCAVYFSLKDDEESAIKKHCATRSHLKSFLRYKEDQSLRAEAERVQRRQKTVSCSSSSKEKKKDKDENEKDKEEHKEVGGDVENEGPDKLWEDVDKDLGDLLNEVGHDVPEDDEEDGSVLDINIGRYDRFKNTEKQKKTEINGDGNTNDEQADDEKENTIKEVTPPPPIMKSLKKEKEDIKNVSIKPEEKAVEAK